jgi:ABC-type multidrug transport system fused ATPase/permease subunit
MPAVHNNDSAVPANEAVSPPVAPVPSTVSDIGGVIALFRLFAWPRWRALLALTLLSMLAAAAAAVQPLMLAPAVDTALATHSTPARRIADVTLNNLGATLLQALDIDPRAPAVEIIVIVAGLYAAAVALAAALNLTAYQLVRWVRTTIAADIQIALFRHAIGLPLSFFNRQRLGDLTSRWLQDAVTTAQSFDPLVKGVIESAVQLAIYGYVLVRTDAVLAGAVVGVSLLHLAVTRFLRHEVRRRTADAMNAGAQVSGHLTETLLGIRIVQSFCAESFESERLRRLLQSLRKATVRSGLAVNSEGPLREVTSAFAVAAAIVISFMALSAGRLTLGGFVLFVVVARQTTIPLAYASAALIQLHAIAGASARLRSVLDLPTPPDGLLDTPALSSGVRFEGVEFHYDDDDAAVLRSFHLEIPRGSVTAIVGPSGAGKSTVLDLLLRLQEPQAGRITFDGTDVRLFRRQSYRRRFGVVPQETLLFNASIEENVTYGRPFDAAELQRALRIAHAGEFVSELSEGTRTVIGDRGTRLSGGQRQRIAIARAVYGRPDVLVLDEATSALDARSERLVRDAIDDAIEGTTAVVVAHRLSTVVRADQIVVLSGGRLVGIGRHDDLMAGNSAYRQLVQEQFTSALPPAAH